MSKARDSIEDLKTIDANLAAKAPLASPVFTGNVGIGVTPEAWQASRSVLSLGGNSNLYSLTAQGASGYFGVSANGYHDGSWKYISTDQAARYEQSGGNHTFTVAPSGTADAAISWNTAMTINNAGIVTKPFQPAFSAYLGSDMNIAASTTTIIPLNQEEFDVGNNFNTSNNRFVAPIAGKYLFTAAIQYSGAAGTSHCNIYINGGGRHDGWIDFGDAKAATQSRVFSLAANDYVQLVAHIAPNATISGNRAKLTGFLIG